MALLAPALLLALATGPGDLSGHIEALLTARPSSTSHGEPLTHRKLVHSDLESTDAWSVTGWPVAHVGQRTLLPRINDGVAPPWQHAVPSQPPADVLSFLAGGLVEASTARAAASDPTLADLLIASHLETVVGYVASTTDLRHLLELVRATGQSPDSNEPVVDLITAVVDLQDRRKERLWDRAAFLVACGLLNTAVSPESASRERRHANVAFAQRVLNSILELRSDSSPALNLLGFSHLWLAARQEPSARARAQRAFDLAIRAEPKNPTGYWALALDARLRGRPDAAIAILATATSDRDEFKKPAQAQLLRHLAAAQWEAREARPWTAAACFRTYQRAIDIHATLEARSAAVAVFANLQANDDWDLLTHEPASLAAQLQLDLVRHTLDLGNDLGTGQLTPAGWVKGHRPLLEEAMLAALHQVDAAVDVEQRDDMIEELHWAWHDYRNATHRLEPALWPSIPVTSQLRGLVIDSNTRRWKARQLKLGKYDARLGAES